MINQNTVGRRQKTVGAIRRVARFKELTATAERQSNSPLIPSLVKRGSRKAGELLLRLGRGDLIGLIVAALFISACGSGGGSGVTGPSSTGNTVYAARNSSLSDGDTVAVDVKVESVSNVYGAAFDVDFDPSKMTYDGYAAGSFLEQNGIGVTYMMSPQPGKLVVGVSRQGTVSGVSGSGTLVTLKFRATGSSSVAFSKTSLKDSSNQPISGITWSGGTVTVQ